MKKIYSRLHKESRERHECRLKKNADMETLNFYLLLLLAGIIIGGALVGTLMAPAAQYRQPGFFPTAYPAPYEYGAYPARRTAALPMALLFLTLLLALIFLGLRREQNNRPNAPAPMEHPMNYNGGEASHTF